MDFITCAMGDILNQHWLFMILQLNLWLKSHMRGFTLAYLYKFVGNVKNEFNAC